MSPLRLVVLLCLLAATPARATQAPRACVTCVLTAPAVALVLYGTGVVFLPRGEEGLADVLAGGGSTLRGETSVFLGSRWARLDGRYPYELAFLAQVQGDRSNLLSRTTLAFLLTPALTRGAVTVRAGLGPTVLLGLDDQLGQLHPAPGLGGLLSVSVVAASWLVFEARGRALAAVPLTEGILGGDTETTTGGLVGGVMWEAGVVLRFTPRVAMILAGRGGGAFTEPASALREAPWIVATLGVRFATPE